MIRQWIQSMLTRHYQDKDSDLRASVTLVFWIQAALIVLLLVTLLIILIFTPETNRVIYVCITSVSALVVATSMTFTIRGFFKVGFNLLIAIMYIAPWVSVCYEVIVRSNDYIPILYVVIPVQISALFFQLNTVVWCVTIQTLMITALIALSPSKWDYNWPSILCFVLLLSALGAITSYVLRAQYSKLVASKQALALSEQKLRELSIKDPLSKLYNRRYLDENFQQLLTNPNSPCGVLMIDVDHFKHINDTYGHTKGDEVIQSVATVLLRNIRKQDIACRFGGDEFLVVLLDCDVKQTFAKAESIVTEITGIIVDIPNNPQISLSVSIGISHYPENGILPNDLVLAADVAMYEAKNCGRNRIITAQINSLLQPTLMESHP